MILNPLSPINLQPSQELGSSGNQQLRRNHKKNLKLFSSIGGLQARINFLHTCVCNDVIPIGFKINWNEQTGLKSPSLSSKVSAILSSASKSLMNEILDVSKQQFDEVGATIDLLNSTVPDEIWQKGIQNYNFCYNQTSQRLTKKIQKLSNLPSLDILLPHRCLSSFLFSSSMPDISQPDTSLLHSQAEDPAGHVGPLPGQVGDAPPQS